LREPQTSESSALYQAGIGAPHVFRARSTVRLRRLKMAHRRLLVAIDSGLRHNGKNAVIETGFDLVGPDLL
jgi:hypothetical protein